MKRFFPWAIAIALLAGQPAVPTPVSAAGIPIRVRIGVAADGLVQIGPETLAAAGVDPSGVDPRTFRLRSLGQEVGFHLTGEEDTRFDHGDRLVFFGQRFRGDPQDEKYTGERVYWLEMGGPGGARVEEVAPATGASDPAPNDFAAEVLAEGNTDYWGRGTTRPDTPETWFWARLVPIGAGNAVSATLPWPAPHPAPGYPGQLEVELLAYASSWSVVPDHRTVVAVGGAVLADVGWDGPVRHVITATVPASLLSGGDLPVEVAARTQPGTQADGQYVSRWRLSYRRLFRADGGKLAFTVEQPGPRLYRTAGWRLPEVEVWDITVPEAPRRLSGAAAEWEGSSYRLEFGLDLPAGARIWMQEIPVAGAAASARLRMPTGLRAPAGGADAVIVTAPSLRPAAERLAEWHRANGRRAIVASVEDIYDEFNDGIAHPRAVSALVAWARDHWTEPSPAFLTLVGDGNINLLGYPSDRFPPEPNMIPPYLAFMDPYQGEVPVDALYADTDGDLAPDIAVGRIPAQTLAQAEVIVDKISGYDQSGRDQPWQQQAVFVADNPDDSGDFRSSTEEIIAGYLPDGLAAKRVYLAGNPPGVPATSAEILAARSALMEAFDRGALLLQFAGHGSATVWAHEKLFAPAQVAALVNGPRLPAVMTFACLDGYFAIPGQASIPELLLRQHGGGAIAAISPAGLGSLATQQRFRQLLMEALRAEPALGTALLAAKQRLDAESDRLPGEPPPSLVATVTLFGDPALRLPPSGPRKLFFPLATMRR